ncbi:hypothetical protein BGZ81_006923 [Podila clonocystis]|nr:hypothetical protein BGZ81_006923 [Podila clonocystis]
MTPSLQIDQALKVYHDHPNGLTSRDFVFVLETIQDHVSSQQHFWESIVTLIRSSTASHRESVKIVFNKASFPPVDWNRAIASALSRVYWNQKQEVFFAQVLHAKETDAALEEQFQKQTSRPEARGQGGDERPRRLFAPFMTTHQIMALTMVESLLHKFNSGYALDLYARLTELGIHMPGRVMSSLVRVAVQSGDGYQLEKIGNLLVSEHQRPSVDRPPLILTAKLMDSFVHGVCQHELYELARDVFNKGVEAGGKYRAQTFTRILNSLSVKDLGFDIVTAATVAEKGKRKGGKKDQERSSASAEVTSKSRKAIAVADPKVVDRYIQVMEQQSILPTVTTLNVLVKLYLEMTQYKVAGAPSWRTAFRRYNPQELVPDVVTNNILLAYYERHKDLNTMLRIYNDMAGELEDGVAAGGLLRKNKKKKALNAITPAPQDNQEEPQLKPEQPKNVSDDTQDQEPQRLTPLQLEQMAEQEELNRLEEQAEREKQARQRQKRGRSQRDIYTYNTMLHALLQHAVESKDIAAIGQCFHDMEQDGISADTVTFNTNILYHIASGDLTSAIQVFRSMQETDVARRSGGESTPDEIYLPSKPAKSRPSYASTSRSEATSPSPTSAPTTPVPDVVSLTSMISGFGQASQMDQATVFFREMTDTFKIEPNLKTYSTLVAGLHRAGDHERAERLWDIVLKEDDLAQQEALERASLDLGGEVKVSGEHEGHGRNRRRSLTVMERRQIEARRKLFRESLKE